MLPVHVAAALGSAVLHASWNAAVKAAPHPTQAMTAQMLLAALYCLPGLLWTGLPAAAAWPWIVASTVTNVLTVQALLRAYELGGFGIVYPVVRATAVLLVVPSAALLTGDRVGPYVLAGVAVIVLSLAVLSYDAAKGRSLPFKALAWILAAGLGTAAYIIFDARGVRAAGSALAYGFVVSITNAAAMCWRQRRLGAPWTHVRAQWRIAVPSAVASDVSYLLILWVWSQAPVAPSAALRDTSSIFALLIAVVLLKESFNARRVLAVLLAAASLPLLRLG